MYNLEALATDDDDPPTLATGPTSWSQLSIARHTWVCFVRLTRRKQILPRPCKWLRHSIVSCTFSNSPPISAWSCGTVELCHSSWFRRSHRQSRDTNRRRQSSDRHVASPRQTRGGAWLCSIFESASQIFQCDWSASLDASRQWPGGPRADIAAYTGMK